MAVVLGTQEINFTDISCSTTVPDDPKAHLMYYLNCMISCIPGLDGIEELKALTDFENYQDLSPLNTAALHLWCLKLSPDELDGKVIFQNDELCGDSGNKFLKVEHAHNMLAVSESVLIGGRSLRVMEIMVYKHEWIYEHYILPFAAILAMIEARRRVDQLLLAIQPSSPPSPSPSPIQAVYRTPTSTPTPLITELDEPEPYRPPPTRRPSPPASVLIYQPDDSRSSKRCCRNCCQNCCCSTCVLITSTVVVVIILAIVSIIVYAIFFK